VLKVALDIITKPENALLIGAKLGQTENRYYIMYFGDPANQPT
jgi:hypothetical protein